ncbi:Endonuclease-reverse transcriptase [Popillia japonica]|uniref:Endonuclease-reverse transcriptase n=1 Tax=Popillia japonica TaxID=7064 RepID=A0AAW1IAR8_POPJA
MDKKRNVAIYIRNKNIGIRSISVGEGYVCIKWKSWCMYGCYCSPNIPHDEFRGYIDVLAEDIKLTGCYCSPNIPHDEFRGCIHDEFRGYIDVLAEDIKLTGREAIVVGDFNSKSPLWGCPRTDVRGKDLTEWAAELTGPERYNPPSNEEIRGRISISHGQPTTSPNGFRIGKYCGEKFSLSTTTFTSTSQTKPSAVEGQREFADFSIRLDRLSRINRECSISVAEEHRNAPYWWNGDVECRRRECHRLRREMTRKHRMQVSAIMQANAEQAYKNAKSDYKHTIINAKRSQWTTLLRELDEDIWGDGFKIVMRHLGRPTPPYNPDVSRKNSLHVCGDPIPCFSTVNDFLYDAVR